MEKGGGGGGEVEPATRAAGGMCDRFLTFLAKNLSVSRMKCIADGPRTGAGDGHPLPTEGGDDDGGVQEDEFAIPIERAEFDFQLGDGGHSGGGVAPTVPEESAATTTTATTGDVPDDQQQDGAAAAAAGADAPEPPAVPAAAVEETKVRRTVTIKDDRPAQDVGGSGGASAPTVERKKSLFRKRQASAVAGGEEQGGGGRVPKRSGLRPRMPQAPRVPSNINERSSTFIEQRKKSFGGKPAPPEK